MLDPFAMPVFLKANRHSESKILEKLFSLFLNIRKDSFILLPVICLTIRIHFSFYHYQYFPK
jgi:hypothetical protein